MYLLSRYVQCRCHGVLLYSIWKASLNLSPGYLVYTILADTFLKLTEASSWCLVSCSIGCKGVVCRIKHNFANNVRILSFKQNKTTNAKTTNAIAST